MTPITAATANPAKLAEIESILTAVGGDRFELRPRPSEVPDVDETGDTLEENAELKASAIATVAGTLAIADDTGLEVDALDGAPGVRSARFAGEHAADADNVALLLERMDGVIDRSARFRTVVCLARPDGRVAFAEGECVGHIVGSPRGVNGFGYDPVFVPADGDGRTFAEMTADEKHSISHRGRAVRAAAEMVAEVVTDGR